jgi:hypothetical protein
MIQVGFPKIGPKIKGYVSENWGSPFLFGFMFLLIISAVSLSAGLSLLANDSAIYAFYALIIGVILQLLCFIKDQKRVNVGSDRA